MWDNAEINMRVADMTTLGRAGVPDDVGPIIAALLSDENRWVNGQQIEVSGGMAPTEIYARRFNTPSKPLGASRQSRAV